MADATEQRCGFIALIGAPNTGKSTLLNRLDGQKVSNVTAKLQTTRRLDRAMGDAAGAAVAGAAAVVLLIDAARRWQEDTDAVIAGLRRLDRTAIAMLNKIDLIPRPRLLGLAERLRETGVATEVFMVSALTGDGVADLERRLAMAVPVGPWLYPPDQLSDLPLRLTAAEISREKAFTQLHQELPYALTVETDRWEDFQDGSVRVDQTIFVQRDSQKAIVLGKGGLTIKRIREAAQEALVALLEQPVHLFINVKVRANWADDPRRYSAWGLRFDI